MKRASVLFLILMIFYGCRSTPDPASPAKPPELLLPSFDAAEVIKVRSTEGYAVVRDPEMHAPGSFAKVYRKGLEVGQVEVEAARRRPYLIVSIQSGFLRPGDALTFVN